MTAVEWLINEWMHLDAEFDLVIIDKNTYWEKLKEKHKQSKEMEKQQIIDAYRNGRSDQQSARESNFYNRMAEQYYNETFKNK